MPNQMLTHRTTDSSQGDDDNPPPPPGQTDNLDGQAANKIYKSGPLFLSTRGIGWTSWKKRWFVLTRTSLVFFRSDPNAAHQKGGEVNLTLGGIDLNNSASVIVKADKKLLTVLFPDGRDGRAFTLKAEASEDLYEWKAALEEALANAPNAACGVSQNGILKNNQSDAADGSFEQANDKQQVNSIIGQPILLALEEVDGNPTFLEKALRFIEEHGVKVEGILRQAADVEDVERRIREYEAGKNEILPDEDAHVIGDCIKYVLRELPSPPVPASCCNSLLKASRTDHGGRAAAMRSAICETFPEPNRCLLQRILMMMQKVASHKAENRMSSSAVAACMAPLLLRSLMNGDCELENDFNTLEDTSLQLMQAAAAANHAQAIVITLLEEYNNIFGEGSLSLLCSDSEMDESEGENLSDDDYEESFEDDDDDYYDDETEGSDEDVDEAPNTSSQACNDTGSDDADDCKSPNGSRSGSRSLQNDNDAKSNQNVLLSYLHDIFEDVDNVSPNRSRKGSIGEALEDEKNQLTCIERSNTISDAENSNFGRKKNTMESIDTHFKDESESQMPEVKRRNIFLERRQFLEQDVAKLKEQLKKENELRMELEAGLKLSDGIFSANTDKKMKAELEEIALVESDVLCLKQKVVDLEDQLLQEQERNLCFMQDSVNQPQKHPNHHGNDKASLSSPNKNQQQPESVSSSKSPSSSTVERKIANMIPGNHKKAVPKELIQGANSTTSALSRLTNRLNFLKEKRSQIASELQIYDKGRNPDLNVQKPTYEGHHSSEQQDKLSSPNRLLSPSRLLSPNKNSSSPKNQEKRTDNKNNNSSPSQKLEKNNNKRSDAENVTRDNMERGKSPSSSDLDKGRSPRT